jgi:hypothetical protein
MDPTQAQPVHLFVLGTGRCGTETASAVLSGLPGCKIIHEHAPPLLSEVSDFLKGRMPEAELGRILRTTRSPEALGGERLAGESNQRLSFILPQLAPLFPQARYLWMIRDGRSNVASVFHRRWYDPREIRVREPQHAPSALSRITADMVGEMTSAEWSALDGFARCCWYWSFTNREIQRRTAERGLNTLKVRLEDLDDRTGELLDFVGLGDQPVPPVKRANAAVHGRPLSPEHWPSAWKSSFERLCGSVMDEHYPGWRERAWDGSASSHGLTRTMYLAGRGWTAWRIRAAKAMMPRA